MIIFTTGAFIESTLMPNGKWGWKVIDFGWDDSFKDGDIVLPIEQADTEENLLIKCESDHRESDSYEVTPEQTELIISKLNEFGKELNV